MLKILAWIPVIGAIVLCGVLIGGFALEHPYATAGLVGMGWLFWGVMYLNEVYDKNPNKYNGW